MRGKDGDVGEWNEYVKQRYDEGMRACLLPGDVHVYTYQKVDKYFPVINPDLWMDLRAYQDEQRKKGEPIKYDFTKINEIWYGRNHIADGIKYHYCGASMGANKITPEIVLLPGAKMGDFPITGSEYGGFKNFRWRPGHVPKGETLKQTI